MDTSNNPLGHLSFRDQLIHAVGYRLAEKYQVEPVVGRMWAKDFLINGVKSPHIRKVLDAGAELYQPLFSLLLPQIPGILTVAVTIVQQENQRGYDTYQSDQ